MMNLDFAYMSKVAFVRYRNMIQQVPVAVECRVFESIFRLDDITLFFSFVELDGGLLLLLGCCCCCCFATTLEVPSGDVGVASVPPPPPLIDDAVVVVNGGLLTGIVKGNNGPVLLVPASLSDPIIPPTIDDEFNPFLDGTLGLPKR